MAPDAPTLRWLAELENPEAEALRHALVTARPWLSPLTALLGILGLLLMVPRIEPGLLQGATEPAMLAAIGLVSLTKMSVGGAIVGVAASVRAIRRALDAILDRVDGIDSAEAALRMVRAWAMAWRLAILAPVLWLFVGMPLGLLDPSLLAAWFAP